MKKKGKGTGTLRRTRWDDIIHREGWELCEHICHGTTGHTEPKRFSHYVLPGIRCIFQRESFLETINVRESCEDCILIPFQGEFSHLKIKLSGTNMEKHK